MAIDVHVAYAGVRRPLADRPSVTEARWIPDVVVSAQADGKPAPPDDLGHAARDPVGRPHDIRGIHVEVPDVDQTGSRGPEEPPPRGHVHKPARRGVPQAVDEGKRAVPDPARPASLAEAGA